MKNLPNLGALLAWVFTWMPAVFPGAVLLDIVHSNLLKNVHGAFSGNAVFSEVTDLSLIFEDITILFGVATIVFSWNIGPARNLFLVSFLLLVGCIYSAWFLFLVHRNTKKSRKHRMLFLGNPCNRLFSV